MKILLLYYEPFPSGQTTHVHSLSLELARRGHAVTVVLPERLVPGLASTNWEGVRLVPLAIRKLIWRPAAMVALVRLVRREAFSVVHIHSQEAGLVARFLTRLSRSRAILYTPQTIDIRNRRYQPLYQRVEKSLSALTDRVVAVNALDASRMVAWGIDPNRVVTIPNGVDLANFANPADVAAARRQMGIPIDVPLVMQVGRLTTQKDPLAFVEGAAWVADRHPLAHFVMVGEGPLKDRVGARMRFLGLEGRIHLPGRLPAAQRLLPAATVVTLTSRWEGTPYSLLEAMGWAKPVVATSVNGCPDIVVHGKTGFLVSPGDPQTWAEHVLRLLGDPELARRVGANGRLRLEERFTLPAMVDSIENLYATVLNGSSRN
jgi:glycosyltransferase involved in cell wall biosynthesis